MRHRVYVNHIDLITPTNFIYFNPIYIYICVCVLIKSMIIFVVVQICEGSSIYASAIANKLIQVMDTSLAAASLA